MRKRVALLKFGRVSGAACRRPWAALALALALILSQAPPAKSQIVALEEIPTAFAHAEAGLALRVERSRLRTYLRGLQRIAETFNVSCRAVRRGSAKWHGCRTERGELDGKRLAYNSDARQFNARIAALTRRAGRDRPKAGEPRAEARRKTELLLDALQIGAGDWQASLRYLRERALKYPNDRALGDALAYLEGMYRGQLMARDFANRYYRHGVKRWLAGDYEMAARAFAQAARDNPDDLKIFRSFAHAVGRQHGGGDCKTHRLCVSGNLPRWASFFGPDKEAAAEALAAEAHKNPRARELRDAVNLLKGIAVYAAGAPTPKRLNPRARLLSSQAVDRIRAKDHLGAARFFAKALQAAEGDRALIYLKHYFEGAAAAGGNQAALPPENLLLAEVHDKMMLEVSRRRAPAPSEMAKRAAEQAFAALRKALRRSALANPFFGVLKPGEIARLSPGGSR